jgi:hypothetical protein
MEALAAHQTPTSTYMKRPNEEMHRDFQNACICYSGQLHSHLISTMLHLTKTRVPSREIHRLQILETTCNTGFLLPCQKGKAVT